MADEIKKAPDNVKESTAKVHEGQITDDEAGAVAGCYTKADRFYHSNAGSVKG